jgi:hypothetical protein
MSLACPSQARVIVIEGEDSFGSWKQGVLSLSLEFAIEYPCSLRARYSEEHLRAWGRLSNIHTRLTTGEEHAPTEDKVRFVENARGELDRTQAETIVCAACPACLPRETAGEGELVGCLGRVTYPIEAQLALDTLDKEDQPRLLRILVDAESPFDGEGTKDLRRVTTPQGLRFFELRLPIKLTREAAHLTTDNLFDLLAGFRSDDSGQTTYTRELPHAAAPDFYDFLDYILRNDLSESERLRLHARSKNYAQFLRLLAALERAEALNARVLID